MSKPVLYLAPQIVAELMYIANSVNNEVGGLGLLSFNGENKSIFVDELFLLDQEVSGAECTLSAKGIALLYDDLIRDKEADLIQDINFWWHSHHTMGVGWSGTDDSTMKEWPGKYLVALVLNVRGDMKARLVQRVEVGPPFNTSELQMTDLEIKIDWKDIWNAEELDEEIKKNVHERPKTQRQNLHQQGVPYHQQYAQSQQNRLEAAKDETKNYTVSHGYEWEGWEEVQPKVTPERGFHEMTEEEFAKSQDSYTDEVVTGVEHWIAESKMSEEEAKEVRDMFGVMDD
jgi:hypothetical protein